MTPLQQPIGGHPDDENSDSWWERYGLPIQFLILVAVFTFGISKLPAAWSNTNGILQAAAWFAAVVAAVYGLHKGERELRATRLQRLSELNWRRAEAAKKLNDELMSDSQALNAMLMVDFPGGRPFRVPEHSGAVSGKLADKPAGTLVELTEPLPSFAVIVDKRTLLKALALRPREGDQVVAVDRFIRDSFDQWLYRLGVMQHYINRRLVSDEDVAYPTDYYVRRLAEVGLRAIVHAYVQQYDFYLTREFLEFLENRERLARRSGPPVDESSDRDHDRDSRRPH
jgi:hypothetical protein